MGAMWAPGGVRNATRKTIKKMTPNGPEREPKGGPKWDRKSDPKGADYSPDLDGFLVSGPFSSKSRPGAVLRPPLGALGPSWAPPDPQNHHFHALLGPKTIQKLTFFKIFNSGPKNRVF